MLGSALAALCMIGVVGAFEPSAKTIKQVMAINKGPQAPLGQLKTALGAAQVDWGKASDLAKEYSTAAADLGSNDPPKGDAAGFKKMAKAYADHAKALLDATDKKDATAAKEAFGKIQMSCMACHKAHRQ
jgi:cytochrome c556